MPTSIALERLPIVVRMPAPEARSTGLVGAEPPMPGSTQAAPAAQRDQLGLTVIPSAATNLQESVAAGTSQLLVLFHPAYPEQFFKLRKVIQDSIDKPARQIFVEGLVLEVSSDALRDLGVKWDLKKGNQTFSAGTQNAATAGDSAFTFLRDSLINVSPSQIKTQLNALVTANKAEILSRPSVMTLDNRQATIRVGADIPVATSKDTGGAGSGRVAFSFQYIPTGILLNVRPRLSDDGNEVSMLIDATVSATVPNQDLRVIDPATRFALASAPTISTRRVQTYARIRNNQPLIIGGLVSRDQVSGSDKVPGVGEVPCLGRLFGHESKRDTRREVIIVLTPMVVAENIRETKAQAPKDEDIFDLRDTALFKEHYRIRAEDLVDSSYLRFNRRFLTYRDIVARVVEKNPEVATRAPFASFTGGRIPGEFVFVTGMMSRMLHRMNAGDPIKLDNLTFIEVKGANDQRPVSVARVLARAGDGNNPLSFFERNPGKALALTFRFGRNSTRAADMFTEPIPDVRIVDCANREEWRDTLWKMNQPIDGVPRHTILLKDESDLKRLQTAVATQNTILNNGGTGAMVFDNWLPGRMLHLQEVSPAWERVLQAPIAQYFFIGEFFTLHFMREHEAAINALQVNAKPDEAVFERPGAPMR
jgi:general secretion pathway protein D